VRPDEEVSMQFMVIERFRAGARPIYERLDRRGRMLPDGLEFVASWVTADLGRVFQVMECDDVSLLQRWVASWEDLADFEILPVVPGGERVGAAVRAGE
jgi:hypothetical protein